MCGARCESYVLMILQVPRPVPRHPSIMFKLMLIHLRTCLAFIFLVHLIQTSAAMQTQRWCQVQRLLVVGFMMIWEFMFQEFQVPWLKRSIQESIKFDIDIYNYINIIYDIYLYSRNYSIFVKLLETHCPWKSQALLGVMFFSFYFVSSSSMARLNQAICLRLKADKHVRARSKGLKQQC